MHSFSQWLTVRASFVEALGTRDYLFFNAKGDSFVEDWRKSWEDFEALHGVPRVAPPFSLLDQFVHLKIMSYLDCDSILAFSSACKGSFLLGDTFVRLFLVQPSSSRDRAAPELKWEFFHQHRVRRVMHKTICARCPGQLVDVTMSQVGNDERSIVVDGRCDKCGVQEVITKTRACCTQVIAEFRETPPRHVLVCEVCRLLYCRHCQDSESICSMCSKGPWRCRRCEQKIINFCNEDPVGVVFQQTVSRCERCDKAIHGQGIWMRGITTSCVALTTCMTCFKQICCFCG